jgi:hypothetical protein
LTVNRGTATGVGQLDIEIEAAEGEASGCGVYETDIGGPPALEAINLKSGVMLTIIGPECGIDGGGNKRGLIGDSGTAAVESATIEKAGAPGRGWIGGNPELTP